MHKIKDESDRDSIIIQFVSASDGFIVDPPIDIPYTSTTQDLNMLLNNLLSNYEKKPQEYLFSIKQVAINEHSLVNLLRTTFISVEKVIVINYTLKDTPQIKHVARCVASLSGHNDSVLIVAFSPDGKRLCSGSGDKTIRFWNLSTSLPDKIGQGIHKNWVLSLSWSPDGIYLASGGMDGLVCIWDGDSYKCTEILTGHVGWITSLSWEPCHKAYPCHRVVSGSRDGSLRIWDIHYHRCTININNHGNTVKSVKWGGEGLIYSASADTTIKSWSCDDGSLLHTFNSHSHWVNCLTLSTDHILRTGFYEFDDMSVTDEIRLNGRKKTAEKRYYELLKNSHERLVSGSEDKTLCLLAPNINKIPIATLTGHTKPINHACFSPNGLWLVSSSFDNSIKLWNGVNGQFIKTFLGHIAPVYMCSWSPDSKTFISASKDSLLKVWDIDQKSMIENLNGHSDEIFGIDWSPNGLIVASGGKDKDLKLWQY